MSCEKDDDIQRMERQRFNELSNPWLALEPLTKEDSDKWKELAGYNGI